MIDIARLRTRKMLGEDLVERGIISDEELGTVMNLRIGHSSYC